MKRIFRCEICDIKFTDWRKRRFCSKKCQGTHMGKNNKGRKLSNNTKLKISNSLKGEKNHFYKRKHTEKTKMILRKKQLGKKLSEKTKQKISDSLKGERNPFYGKKHTIHARQQMGRDVSGKKNPMYGKGYLLRGSKNGAWKGGISFGMYGEEFNEELKAKLRKRDKFVCQICNKNGFVIHHVDYNKKNHKKSNLITLCQSCHGKTGFNREYWKSLLSNKLMRNYYG